MGCASSSAPVHTHLGEVDLAAKVPRRSTPRHFHEDYILGGKLGKGAFASVHTAQKVSEGTQFAVKITDLRGAKPSPGGDKEELVDLRTKRAVEKEVAILRRVGIRTNCVGVYDDYIEGIFSYIVMEKCDSTLLQALEHAPELTENTLARMLTEMLQALVTIHKLEIVHRDIKPDNFLCHGERSTVKLCDFGLAETVHGNVDLKGVYGTAPFMSPEMLAATGYDARTDVWSLGVIAYVLMFGQFPYQPIESNAKAMKAAILAGVPEPSFRPRPSLDHGSRVSANATLFLHDVLNRDRSHRPSASSLMNHAWITAQAAPSEQWGAPSLRPMLYAAKRVGAFDTRALNDNDKSGLGSRLAQLQAQYHKGGPETGAPVRQRRPEKDSAEIKAMCRVPSSASSGSLKVNMKPEAHHKSDSTTASSHASTAASGSWGTSYNSKRSRSCAVSREP